MVFFRSRAKFTLLVFLYVIYWNIDLVGNEAGYDKEHSIDVLLLGKTGNGRSDTGNAILGFEAFEVSDGSESETKATQVAWANRHNRLIKVVDGPGIYETSFSQGEAAMKIAEDMVQAILQSTQGFHAILLVFKYPNRFTEEEVVAIEILKARFGSNFVREFVILVFTHGELFDRNNERTPGRTFQNWLQEQKGAMRTLLEEVDYRAVLFYNSVPERNEAQVHELLTMVDGLKSRGIRYINEIYQKAAATREQLIVKENAPELRKKIQEEINMLVYRREKAKQDSDLNDEDVIRLMGDLEQEARNLETKIAMEDKSTGVLDTLKQVVRSVRQAVDSLKEVLEEKKRKADTEVARQLADQKYKESLEQLRGELEKANTTMAQNGGSGIQVGNVLGGLQITLEYYSSKKRKLQRLQ